MLRLPVADGGVDGVTRPFGGCYRRGPDFVAGVNMAKFRKKPVVIEAMQIVRDMPIVDVQDFCPYADVQFDPDTGEPGVNIPTLEGVMHANIGDWIIKGVAGEFYPCKPDIFAATYEAALDDTGLHDNAINEWADNLFGASTP